MTVQRIIERQSACILARTIAAIVKAGNLGRRYSRTVDTYIINQAAEIIVL
jgi:hypothetical protein